MKQPFLKHSRSFLIWGGLSLCLTGGLSLALARFIIAPIASCYPFCVPTAAQLLAWFGIACLCLGAMMLIGGTFMAAIGFPGRDFKKL